MKGEVKTYVPEPYQQRFIELALQIPYIGLFLGMGAGKTIIALTVVWWLKFNYFTTRRVLVIAPKKVCESTWQEEAAGWAHTQGFTFSLIAGTAKQREKALYAKADIHIVSRDNIHWLVGLLKNDWFFDMVIIDESSSFKSHKSRRFKALKSVRPCIERIMELTGTPRPQGVADLWSQVYLLDQGERLGDTFTKFQNEFQQVDPYRGRNMKVPLYVDRDGAADLAQYRIRDICFSLRVEDYVQMPEMLIEDYPVAFSPSSWAAYKTFEKEAVLEYLEDREEKALTATSAAALSNKLCQFCNGAVYDEDKNVIPVHSEKEAALEELLEQLGDEHALIAYWYKFDLDIIKRVLKKTKKRWRVFKNDDDKQAWNAGEVDYLLVHPASVAYGLNLQHGGRYVVWFSLSWPLELYQQLNKRLHRRGMGDLPCVVINMYMAGGRDEQVKDALTLKDGGQRALMDSLKLTINNIKQEAHEYG